MIIDKLIHTSTTKQTSPKSGAMVFVEVSWNYINTRYEAWIISRKHNGIEVSRLLKTFNRNEEQRAIRYAEVTTANWNL